jgi:7-cyano-7-deazaguanine synthase
MRRPDVCLTIDYGQKQSTGEIRAATNISEFLELNHQIMTVDLSRLGSGQMVGKPAIKSASDPGILAFSESAPHNTMRHEICRRR